jgi:hypothetical protein
VKLLTLVSLSLLASCTEEPPPVCPTGDCTLPSLGVVTWSFNSYPELMFSGDTCRDMDAKTVRVDVTGIDDPTVFETKDVDCNQQQASFVGLAAGNYSVAVTPLDAPGNAMINAPVTTNLEIGFAGSMTTVDINVPWEAWLGTYTGTLLFNLAWGGASCENAVPNVMNQTLTLMVNGGGVASVMTDVGQKLDGTDPRPCRPNTGAFAQFAEGLPFGPATFTVSGTDAGGVLAFEHTFDTFVGAAKNNPTLTFDVAAAPPPPSM